MSQIACWCADDVPEFSVLWIKAVLNPIAQQTPVVMVTRPGMGEHTEAINEYDLDLLTPTAAFEFAAVPVPISQTLYTSNLRGGLLTNGPIAAKAKTIFYCRDLLFGVHWLRYDEELGADKNHLWFFPRDDTWFLGSIDSKEAFGQSSDLLSHWVHGVVFRRMGDADELYQCVPVIMSHSNFQVDSGRTVS